MEASELRIGNWVNGIGGPCLVRGTTKGGIWLMTKVSETDEFAVSPIPLTEEWLLKFGFEPYENIGNRRLYHIETFIVESSIPAAPVYYTSSRELICFIEYVHQLQNLYFALTGEELTIKQD